MYFSLILSVLNFVYFCCFFRYLYHLSRADMGSKRKPKKHLKSQVKKSKIQNSRNFEMETVFDRFPTLSDDIFEILDEKSLANCVEVNRKWQTTIANQKVYLKKKIQEWSKYCKSQWLKSENLIISII